MIGVPSEIPFREMGNKQSANVVSPVHPAPGLGFGPGVVSTVAGDGTQSCKDGAGTAAGSDQPVGIARSSDDELLIAEFGSHRIRRFRRTSGMEPTA